MIVYEVAVFNDHDEPTGRRLFTDRQEAEIYQDRLPGSEIEEVPITTEAPHQVTVHHYETYMLPDGVTMSPRLPHLAHRQQERWSDDLWPPAAEWSHPDSHTHVMHRTTEPLICLLETYGLDQRATKDAHLDEAARLRQEAKRDPEPPALVANAARGDETVCLSAPVPVPCRITLSAGSPYLEQAPVYECFGTGPHVARLGIRVPVSAEHPYGVQHAKLTRPHVVGGAVEVEDA